MPTSPLCALENLRTAFGPQPAQEKLALLGLLARSRLRNAREVERLHELLLFMRAYPDDGRILARTRALLARFARRADVRAHRDALENSGIAGTTIRYPFFWPTARWLAARWPQQLSFDRGDRDAERAIAAFLGAGRRLSGFAALDRLRPGGQTDAVHFIRLVEATPGDDPAKERFYDAIEPVIELRPAPGSPSRTLAGHRIGPVAWQRAPLDRTRPDLALEIRRAPRRIRRTSLRTGRQLLDLARGAMVTRSRDLDAFAYGDPRSVRIVDDGAGLAFVLSDVVPERRALVESPLGVLTLKNAIPVGYLDIGLSGRHAEIAFNTFPAFRNGDAARTLARVLAMAWHALGARTFGVAPYQLGNGNPEAIASGAWWFYYKLGFRPRDAAARAIARSELTRQRAAPGRRTSQATLARLARWPMYFDPRSKR